MGFSTRTVSARRFGVTAKMSFTGFSSEVDDAVNDARKNGWEDFSTDAPVNEPQEPFSVFVQSLFASMMTLLAWVAAAGLIAVFSAAELISDDWLQYYAIRDVARAAIAFWIVTFIILLVGRARDQKTYDAHIKDRIVGEA